MIAPLSLCFVAGLASAAGFGHANGWAAPILALAVLFYIAARCPAPRAALCGWLYGLGHFGLGVSWTYASLRNYGHLPVPQAALIAALLPAALAGYYALAVWLARIASRFAGPLLAQLRLVGAWTLAEAARADLLTGFGWLAAGYAQVPASPLAGWIPLLGVLGATGMSAALAGLLALLASPHFRAGGKTCAAAAAVALLACGATLRHAEWTVQTGPELHVSVLQGAVSQQAQWLAENIRTVPQIYLSLAQRSAGRLIVAPETSVPANWADVPARYAEDFSSLAAKRDGAMILGAFSEAGNGKLANSAIALGNFGTVVYSKRKLTPYGEFLPFAKLFEPLLERARIPFSSLEPGTGDGTLRLPFAVLGAGICYEDVFARLYSENDAQLLVNLTNDSWFDGTLMPAQHLQISAARALENGRWMVRASNTGPSALIDPNGKVVSTLAALERGILEGSVELREGDTPYRQGGDWPAILLAVAALVRPYRLKSAR